jgi:hypothetical protein
MNKQYTKSFTPEVICLSYGPMNTIVKTLQFRSVKKMVNSSQAGPQISHLRDVFDDLISQVFSFPDRNKHPLM